MKQEMTEVKMSMIRKRSEDHNQKKMYESKEQCDCVGHDVPKNDRASGGCWVDRRIREETDTVHSLDDDDSTSQEDHEDDEGSTDEREIEGETVDLYDKLMEMTGNKNDLT